VRLNKETQVLCPIPAHILSFCEWCVSTIQ